MSAKYLSLILMLYIAPKFNSIHQMKSEIKYSIVLDNETQLFNILVKHSGYINREMQL